MKVVIANKEISKEVIFDRNKLFTSKYWDAWTKELEIHVKLSTSYHSKTDEQIERTNQTLEFYLRKFVNYHQTNWIELLLMTQISYNNSVNATTQKTSFYAKHEYNSTLNRLSKTSKKRVSQAVQHAQVIKELMTRNIDFMIEKTIYQANKHRFEDSNLKKRDKVYVLRKNIATSRSSKKLDQIKIESFEIVKNIRDINYELKLLDQMRIHFVFHKSLLESTSAEVSILIKLSNDYVMNQKDRYQVQKILKESEDFKNERRKYLVKWKDYDKFENTWELRSNLDNCQNAMIAYLKRRQNRFAKRNWACASTSREKRVDRHRQQNWTKKSFFFASFSYVLLSSVSEDSHSSYHQARETYDVNNDIEYEDERSFASSSKSLDSTSHSHE